MSNWLFLAIFANINEIIEIAMNKVCTTKNIGKNVRVLLFLAVISAFLTSCELDTNEPNDYRDNITGAWKCIETDSKSISSAFEAVISKHNADTTKVLVDNFASLGAGIIVYVGMNQRQLTIPKQTVDGFEISGSGIVATSFNKIDWNYYTDDGGGKEYFTAVYNRK